MGAEGSIADQFQPCGCYYFVRFLEPEAESAGGIALPETVRGEAQSAIVLAHGPGQTLKNGATYPMQCGVGDLVIAKPNHFDRLDAREAFLSDLDLVAYRRWEGDPDADEADGRHGPLRAANDYVLVRPDAAKQVDAETGATVRTGEGGILIACASAAGGEVRENQRGDELAAELEALSRSRKYHEQPSEYYRHRVLHDYMEALSDWELKALGAALKRKGNTHWRAQIPRRPLVRAGEGEVVDVGPGRVRPDGQRKGAGSSDEGADGCPLRAGDRVLLDRDLQAVVLCGAGGAVWAVRAQFIAAVMEGREDGWTDVVS